MKWKSLFLLLLGMFVGCDEFSLKKTATIRSVFGNLRFDPSRPEVVMNLHYDMMNFRRNSLREVYFYCHESVSLEAVFDGKTSLRIERAVGVGMPVRVYRVKLSEWLPGTRRVLRLQARIVGPVETQGFTLTSEGVVLDSQKIWLPISFDEIPAFRYTFTIETPEEYIAIAGAKLLEEKTNQQTRISLWQSESTNLLLSGNIVIGHFSRVGSGRISLYLPQKGMNISEKRLSTLLDLLREGQQIMIKHVGEYPFSETRVVFVPKKMAAFEARTDGLFLGNLLLLDEDLAFALTNAKKSLLDSVILSQDSWLYVMKVILHEMVHGYLGYDLLWEQEDTLPIESLTEAASLKLLEWLSPETYRLSMNRLYYEWRVMGVGMDPLQVYTYRTLLLASTLSPREFFRLLRGLRSRYLYSRIDAQVLLQTLIDEGETNRLTPLLSFWEPGNFWQMGVFPQKTEFVFSHTFPITLPVTFVVEKQTEMTNISQEVENNSKASLSSKGITALMVESPLQWLDESIGDDMVFPELMQVVSNITAYYAGETNGVFEIGVPPDGQWRSPPEDRFFSLVAFPLVEVVPHRYERREDRVFLYAYKKSGGKLKTYALFLFRFDKKRWVWEGVYNPSLSYAYNR